MRPLRVLGLFCIFLIAISAVHMRQAIAQVENPAGTISEPSGKKDELRSSSLRSPSTGEAKSQAATLTTIERAVRDQPIWAVTFSLAATLIVIGVAVLLYRASKLPQDPLILKLGPSFFFWLGMGYMGMLLLAAAAFSILWGKSAPYLVGDILPIAVPWFGALGAVAISLEGVFTWSKQWDDKYNYWHIGRPVFGAVLGIVSFFLYVLVITASGNPPKFLESDALPPAKDFIIFYMVAFLVGYREETFRELIKRVTDLVLKAGSQPSASPAVSFSGTGVTALEIGMPATAANAVSRLTVEVKNSGSVPLIAPVVSISSVAPTPAQVFTKENDQVTGGSDLAPGQARTVDVSFKPSLAGNYEGKLIVTAANLPAPKTIRIAGKT